VAADPYRLRVTEYLEMNGYLDLEEWCEENLLADEAPAMCSEGCIVEPDGRCPHGFPSLPLAAGLI